MYKKILLLSLVGLLVFTSPALGAGVEIEDYRLAGFSDHPVKLVVPRLSGLKTELFQRTVNEEIQKFALDRLKEFNEGANIDSRLEIDYIVKSRGQYISLLLVPKARLNSRDHKMESKYINIDPEGEKILNLRSAAGLKGMSLAEISRLVAIQDPDLRLEDRQDFYFNKKGDLVLVFDQGPGQSLELDLGGTGEEVLEERLVSDNIVKENISLDLVGDISINIPRFIGLEEDFQEGLNQKIRDDVGAELEAFSKRAGQEASRENEFKVNFKARTRGQLSSIELNVYSYILGEDLGQTRRYYYNVDRKLARLLDLEDIFQGPDYLELINKKIGQALELEGDAYYRDGRKFKTIGPDQDFYIDDRANLVVAFPQASIGPRELGLPSFRINFYDLKDRLREDYRGLGVAYLDRIRIIQEDYRLDAPIYISSKGNLMLPIRELAGYLDIDVDFNPGLKIIYLSQGDYRSTISIRENLYSYNDAKVFLEDEAKSLEGRAYVPLDYIDKVLKAKISIGDGILNIEYK